MTTTNQREGGATKSGDTLTESSSEHDKLLFKCRMAENSERFDDMVKYITDACEKSLEAYMKSPEPLTNPPLGPSERNFLSVAYKNSVGSKRNALRCLQAMRSKYESRGGQENVKIIDEYYETVRDEMQEICGQIIHLIGDKIINPELVEKLPHSLAVREYRVFFEKMTGDYYRYIAEFAETNASRDLFCKDKAISRAKTSYQQAHALAAEGDKDQRLPPSHPIRLGLCLNYSVFLYEIEKDTAQAIKLGKEAFDDALDNLDNTGELEYKDSTLILQLLRDNNLLWGGQDNNNNNNANPSQAAGANPAVAAAE